jgi:guanylate kinase
MEEAGEFLEINTVSTVHAGAALYGISYTAVRSVASGGRVCLVALDVAGATQLFGDDRIDASFVLVTAPTVAAGNVRLRARLKEHDSTVQKRLAWAQEQVLLKDQSVRDKYPIEMSTSLWLFLPDPNASILDASGVW